MDQILLQELHFNPKFSLHPKQKEIFKQIIEWKTQPPISKTGRSSYLLVENEDIPFEGIKIKGCGYFDLYENKVFKPVSKEKYDAHIKDTPDGVKERHYQIEVDSDGVMTLGIPGKRPFGAQTLDRAKLEYDVHETLYNKIYKSGDKGDKNNIFYPFYFPVGYGEYKDLKSENEKLGITMLGLPIKTETPLAAYFEAKTEEAGFRISNYLMEYWQKNFAPLGQATPLINDLIDTLKHLSFEFGRSLSLFHEHFVDFDSHFFNATVNSKNQNVILYDFDHVLKASEIPPKQYFYYALKDFAIGFVAVLSNFLLSGWIDVIKKTDIKPDDIIRGYIEGYFNSFPKEKLNINFINKLWEQTIDLSLNDLFSIPMAKRIHPVHEFCEKQRDRLYIDIFNIMFNKIKEKNPELDISLNEHEKTIAEFFKSRNKAIKTM